MRRRYTVVEMFHNCDEFALHIELFMYTMQLSVSSHVNMEDRALLQEIVVVLMGGVDSTVKTVGTSCCRFQQCFL